jgi:hypothetical protein
MHSRLGRRSLLRGLAAAGGAALGTRIAGGVGVGGAWIGNALAATEKSAVVVIHFVGGYNSVFSSADSFTGSGAFLASPGNVVGLGNGLVVDKATLGALPPFALQHMATIGNRHGSTDHAQAILRVWSDGTRNYTLRLAAAMGGTAPIKCAQIRGTGVNIPSPAEGGVSAQAVNDIGSVIETLVGGDLRSPDRAIAAKAMAASQTMAQRTLDRNPQRGPVLDDGFSAGIDALEKTAPPFDYRSLPGIYGLQGTAIQNGFASKLCAAELLIRAGTNVINVCSENDWDTHGSNGSVERGRMVPVIQQLQKFLARVSDPAGLGATHNVVTVLIGDFARSLPTDDHQGNLSATVIGKYVKVGTTGRVGANVGLPAGTPASNEMWAYVAAVAKAQGQPFGPNPHALVL